MSVEMIPCPACGSAMAANSAYCPNCGHTNAFVAPGSAVQPATPRPEPPQGGFATPMPPPDFSGAPSAPGDTPQMGAPTINVGAMGGQQEASWQPGQYGEGAPPPPAYSAQPLPPGAAQAQYSPPPPAYAPTQNLGQYHPPQVNYQYQNQIGVAGIPQRDPMIALLLELLGYVWFLGIGHIYAGRTSRGITLLIAYWAYWVIVGIMAFTLVLAPIACLMALVHPFVPILSGLWIRSDVEKDNTMGRQQYR